MKCLTTSAVLPRMIFSTEKTTDQGLGGQSAEPIGPGKILLVHGDRGNGTMEDSLKQMETDFRY